jgi:hypothetical protein
MAVFAAIGPVIRLLSESDKSVNEFFQQLSGALEPLAQIFFPEKSIIIFINFFCFYFVFFVYKYSSLFSFTNPFQIYHQMKQMQG